MLDGERGGLLPPIRSEIFGSARFVQHGQSLGLTHRAAETQAYSTTFFPRLKSNISALREAHSYIGEQARTGYDISPAAEWLLDNFHLIEAQVKEIHAGLSRSYFRTLPVLVAEPLAGLPRIYGVAWAFIAHTDSAFDEGLLVQYLSAYQGVCELKLSELWALPTTLRVVLVENLRRLAERIATHKAARELANQCFDSIDAFTVDDLNTTLRALEARGVHLVFLAQIAQRAQDRRVTGDSGYSSEFYEWLQREVPDLASLQREQSAAQAADNLSVSNAVNSLRLVGDSDWADIIASSSELVQTLLQSPLFSAEDVATRDQTLHAVERLAKRSGRTEVGVARVLLGLMQSALQTDVSQSTASYWLIGPGRINTQRILGITPLPRWIDAFLQGKWNFALYATAVIGLSWFVVWFSLSHGAGGSPPWGVMGLLGAIFMVFPASEAVIAVVNRLISESVRPRHLPRLALAHGIPAEHRVLVVVPAMLTHADGIMELAQRLERHYLANPEPMAQFALLTDWTDATQAQVPGDADLLDTALHLVAQLNTRHPRVSDDTQTVPRFILLHRERSFCETEQCWIGWERKRGKLEQLVSALVSNTSTGFLDFAESSAIACHTPYIVTLDSDTQLPPGRLRDLVGIAAHPINQPQFDPALRRISSGYGILQPRIATPLPSEKDLTLFHWLFAGQCGVDTYSAASSEVYQDLFSEGTFTGKGLLNVAAMHQVLSGRLPVGQILSHDLLEGALARCAAVTDINFIEEAPFHPDVAASRVHRWTRGDWQLLPMMLRAVRPSAQVGLGAIHLWKMWDNLRRSMVGPLSLALLLLTLSGQFISPWIALSLVTAAYCAGPILGALAGFASGRENIARVHFYREAGIDLWRAAWGALWHVAQLLQQSMMYLDAIGLALYRSVVSRRHLLQWTTAAVAQAEARRSLFAVIGQHVMETIVALLLLATLLFADTPYPWLAAALCLLWSGSPLWTWCASRTRVPATTAPLSIAEQNYLAGIARDTWRLFERCVTAQDNFLPPDNLQLTPHDMLAHRTSPTNIGLYLLSVSCARQFGWIGTHDLLNRLESTLATLLTMQRHRGHFLNWYDTQTREPLLPMYVSTVDSGNLTGHLVAVAQSCRELAESRHDASANVRALRVCRDRMSPYLAARHTLTVENRVTLKNLLADYRATKQSVRRDATGDLPAATRTRLLDLANRLETLGMQAEYGFLYHPQRRLLHIGYRVAEQQCDAGFYDLLASESRLTSLLAIAKGDISVRHWSSLGRPFFAVGTQVGLKSWTGSMFEYLMPSLVLEEPRNSVLREAGFSALCEQMRFASDMHVPWGISESAYAASDHTLAYQYAPQGVPRLALRRTPVDELVVAPYSTALAAMIAPHLAIKNFKKLESLGARGQYGFMDALDYSATRSSNGESFTRVNTFMAHHQGMSIVSLANVLMGFPAQRWAMSYPPLQAAISLLHERIPREVSPLLQKPAGMPQKIRQRRRSPGVVRDVIPGDAALAATHLLSNGSYTVAIRPNGAGWSHWGQIGIGRQRDDALRDAQGSFFYLRRDARNSPVSLTQNPAGDPTAQYSAIFHADRLCLDAAWADMTTRVTVWVSPEDDIEFRQVEIHNVGDAPLQLELMSAFEVTLAHPNADESHPAFSNMFVRAHWLGEHNALLFERRARLASEPGVHLAHFLVSTSPIAGLRTQTDRQIWRGRNNPDTSLAAKLDRQAGGVETTPVELITGLDPICALSVPLEIAPGTCVQLTFATTVSDNLENLHTVIDKYQQLSNIRRASLMSATLAGIRLRALRISAEDYVAMQAVTTALIHTLSRPPSSANRLDQGAWAPSDRSLLWRFGMSGDRPFILVTVGVMQGAGMLRSLMQALNIWSWAGLACDMVVINSEPPSYLMELQREINFLRERYGTATGFFCLPLAELTAAEIGTLTARARFCLYADGRPFSHHVTDWIARHAGAQEAHKKAVCALPPGDRPARRTVAPVGQFISDSGEFSFTVSASQRPLRPWINVLANPALGTHLSEAGGGYTWARNSRLNQLTPWSNDAVADPPGEWFLLQDRRSDEVWSVSPNAWADPALTYQVTHGQGYSTVQHTRGSLEVTTTWCVDAQDSVKQVTISLRNMGSRTMHLRCIAMLEWIMGANRTDRSSVRTAFHQLDWNAQKLGVLSCTQNETSAGFGEGTAFLCNADSWMAYDDWTCDRREFFDVHGRMVLPRSLLQSSGSGLDPCAALSLRFSLAPGESVDKTFLIGYGQSSSEAMQTACKSATELPAKRLAQVRSSWDKLLGSCTVKTPDPLFDAMVNRWLLYQTVVCRLWSKAGFYQAGGATGFRDQLQDSMALAWAAPHLLREQIVLCASRQFAQGDVQHWWHAPSGAGVRTHFSDDLLWLPVACAQYVRATGDLALLEQKVHFLEGAPVPEGAEDAYYTPGISAQLASVYEHAARSIDHSLKVGVHGLPLMGGGDWNDGMNLVGIQGKGESVWLGWFLCQLVADFAPLAIQRGDTERARRWQVSVQGWKTALLGAAWDGEWFKRAFFDNGQALGSQDNTEGRIDLIAQAWSVLSGVPPLPQQRMAMRAMHTQLVDEKAGLIKLLTPPLDQAVPSAGYIQAYPKGVRENGGQYSHAGVWALMATAELARWGAPDADRSDLAYRYFTYLSPAHRAADPLRGAVYGLEPYAIAGDVYSEAPYTGRGGWSWYTGAAAWLYRAAHESLFGLQRDALGVQFHPCLPSHWPRAEMTLQHEGRALRFIFIRALPEHALTASQQPGAQLLQPGQALLWEAPDTRGNFVIPLL